MKGDLYLFVSKDSKGYGSAERLTGRVSTTKLIPETNEVMFKLSLNIPNELFEKPVYQAELSITKGDTSDADVPKLEIQADAVNVWLTGKEEKKGK